jgi:hypothetical protein
MTQAFWLRGRNPMACMAMALFARVWLCITHARSVCAMWIALWITNPAGLSSDGSPCTTRPSRSTFSRAEAVISSKKVPSGFTRKWCSGPGSDTEMWVEARSDIP